MKRKLFISFLILILMVLLMRWQGNSLITPVSPNGILDLEFAKTGERMRQLKLFWNHSDVVLNIFLDFLFIAAYTWFFVTACNYIKQRNGWTGWSRHFTGLSIAAGSFDVLENFLMLLVWNERFSAGLLQIVYYAAAIKFILAGMIVLYLLISIPFVLKTKNNAERGTN